MLSCWKDKAEERPTFTKIVSRYHDGLIPGTSKAEHGEGYVLLGLEENTSQQHQQRAETNLNNTSAMDITNINDQCQNMPSAGTTFHVTLLYDSKGRPGNQPIGAEAEMEYYIEMSSVFVNQAVQDNDNVADEGNHVTSSADHEIADVNHVTHQPDQNTSPRRKLN